MQKSLRQIAEIVKGEVVGDADVIITGFSGIKEARQGDITFLANPKYLPFADKTQASAIIVSRDVKITSKPVIRTDHPSLAFTQIVSILSNYRLEHPKGIHPTALIGDGVMLGREVAIGPYVVVEDNTKIGDKSIIYSGCFIGRNCKIGENTLIYSNVSLREDTEVGNRVIINCGTVLGSDGFGFVTVDGKHHKIPQQGSVIIKDDVEIGANVTIDRARFDKTIIGKGTKIDNLVHIAHNVVTGENCLIVAQVGVSGTTSIGNNVILAGQVGVVGHISIGDDSVVMAQSGVSKSIPAKSIIWGYPAKPADEAKRVNACVQNLPKLHRTVIELKKKVEELELKLKKEQ
jgi:UDP-3-O-[3-hydroxymyristoyl] glucosamine N-acyltransferase